MCVMEQFFPCRHAVPIPLDRETCYIGQYLITVHSKPTKSDKLMTVKPLPFIDRLDGSTTFVASFLSDPVSDNEELIARCCKGFFVTIAVCWHDETSRI